MKDKVKKLNQVWDAIHNLQRYTIVDEKDQEAAREAKRTIEQFLMIEHDIID